jgi:hypothetical protein
MEKEITLVLSYLDKIGEKLGIGANMLWPYLMKQQIIEAYMNVAVIVLLAAIGLFTWKRYSVNPQRHAEKWVDGMYFYTITMIASGILGFVATLHFIFHGVFQLVNTEYVAFKVLVDLLGKVK